jgi:3-methyl-2-oxobutanoate hydroxymethyltransferase
MKIRTEDLAMMKGIKPISMLTAYTCPVARCIEEAGIPVILVGDTVGMVEMGFDSTRDVTIEHMEYPIGAVRRGAKNTHIIGDLPYRADKDLEMAFLVSVYLNQTRHSCGAPRAIALMHYSLSIGS